MAGVTGIAVLGGALPAGATPTHGASFVDPTAEVVNPSRVKLEKGVYVGPFAKLQARRRKGGEIRIGTESNVQDSVLVLAHSGKIKLGKKVILAHGAVVKGPASIGGSGRCHKGESACPSFVGFNSQVAGATVEKDAMVTHLARVAPGVRIPSGRKVLPGKNIASQDQVAAKTAPVTDGDREFMNGVIHVNTAFAMGYTKLEKEDENSVRGVGPDPGGTEFNKTRELPEFGHDTSDAQRLAMPSFRNRIIGDVRLEDTLESLAGVMGSKISLRADEGERFTVGKIAAMGSRSTLHALEHTEIELGSGGIYGYRSLVHGGPADHNPTTTGNNVTLGSYAVLFRSQVADNVTIGHRSYVQQSDLAAGTKVPPRTVMVAGEKVGEVEW